MNQPAVGDNRIQVALDLWHAIRIPAIGAALFVIIYVIELSVAGSFHSGAAYQLLTELQSDHELLLRILAPFLHSDHGHVAGNLGFFFVLSVLILRHEQPRDYLLVFLMAGWFTASIITWAAGGGIGFGISGANAALAGWEGVYQGRILSRKAMTVDSLFSLSYVKQAARFTPPAAFALLMLGQGIGLVAVPSGVSVLGHASGALFGILFGALIPFQDRMRAMWRPIRR